ncbi:helix-turn-helix domain-containing protein, partial [Heliobacterium undosum]
RAENTLGEVSINKETFVTATHLRGTQPKDPDTPGARLFHARSTIGLTVHELSSASDVTEATISYIENNHGQPTLRVLKKLSVVLDVSLSFLGCYDLLPEESIGQRVRKHRLMNGLTIREFATLIGVSEKSVRNWEKDNCVPLSDIQGKLRF